MHHTQNHDKIPVKYRIRKLLDYLAVLSGLTKYYEYRMRQGITVLMYHRVLPDKDCTGYPLDSLIIPESVFNKQIGYLAKHYRVLPLSEALETANSDYSAPNSKPMVAITFDDGYLDNYQIVLPILQKHRISGTFYITTGFIEKKALLWFDKAALVWQALSRSKRGEFYSTLQASLKRSNSPTIPEIGCWMQALKDATPELRQEVLDKAHSSLGQLLYDIDLYMPMSKEQIATIAAHGHEIGSHTVNHPILPQLDKDLLNKELSESAKTIHKWTDKKPTSICYPNGDYNATVARVAIDCGYTNGCTTTSGINLHGGNVMALKRIPITMKHTTYRVNRHDELGFRSELCMVRDLWR